MTDGQATLDSDSVVFSLRANRDLLDPTFDRYILQADACSNWRAKLGKRILHKLPSISQWGYQQIKAHTLGDRLVVDHFNESGSIIPFFMFLEDRSLASLTFDQDSKKWSNAVEVAQLMEPARSDEAFPSSLHFLNAHFAITSNGAKGFCIWWTGDRSIVKEKWEAIYNFTLELHNDERGGDRDYPTIILDARSMDDECQFEILLLTVTLINKEQKAEKMEAGGARNGSFRTHLIWVSVTTENHANANPPSTTKFVVERVREVQSDNKVEFACFDNGIHSLVVFGSGSEPRFVWDSAEKQKEEDSEQCDELNKPVSSVELIRQGGADEPMDTTLPTEKSEDQIMQKTATEDTRQQFNVDQLEECDRPPEAEDDVNVFWLDGEHHKLVKMAVINELLFTSRFAPFGPSPCFATRYDVDSIVWKHEQVDADQKMMPASHLFTLNAFGFIQAGHQDKRFLGCSSDGRYAVLVNRINHVFIYLQSSAVSSVHELKNRRTGKLADKIAKQLVLSMVKLDPDYEPNDATNEFIGFYANSKYLFLLTQKTIYAVEVPN